MSIDKTQQEFEAWVVYDANSIEKDPLGIYVSQVTRTKWRAWQAAIATRQISDSKQIETLLLALDNIANPIPYLRAEAEQNGNKLDGYSAVQLAKDPEFLKDIAKKAIQAAKRQEGE